MKPHMVTHMGWRRSRCSVSPAAPRSRARGQAGGARTRERENARNLYGGRESQRGELSSGGPAKKTSCGTSTMRRKRSMGRLRTSERSTPGLCPARRRQERPSLPIVDEPDSSLQ
eukprot:scaffold1342_cov204-Pinguiococcus_pyrenoidosus.AAC.10